MSYQPGGYTSYATSKLLHRCRGGHREWTDAHFQPYAHEKGFPADERPEEVHSWDILYVSHAKSHLYQYQVTSTSFCSPVCAFLKTFLVFRPLKLNDFLSHLANRYCVMSSWWQEVLKCQPTGWSWRPAVPTSVPCSQVCRPRLGTSTGTPHRYLYISVCNCVELFLFS